MNFNDMLSADTSWSLQILFPDYNFIGSASKDGSILTPNGSLAIHQRARANHTLMGLRRFRKITKDFLFLHIKTNNSTTQGREILVN